MQSIPRATIALLCAASIVLLPACDSAPPTVVEVVQQARPTPTPAPGITPTPISIPAPAPSPGPTPSPTSTSTPTPTPTATATPSPTPTPIPLMTIQEALASGPSAIIPWFESPPDQYHEEAAGWIRDIWATDAEAGASIARLPWVRDGVFDEGASAPVANKRFSKERKMLEAMLSITVNNGELAREITTYPWFVDNVDDGDLTVKIQGL